MKGEECKFRVQEDYPPFLNSAKHGPAKDKKLLILAWVLVLTTMSIMIAFTFRSLNEIGELKDEIDKLKKSFEVMQTKINDLDLPDYVVEDVTFVNDNRNYDDEYYDISYEDDISEEFYNDLLQDHTKLLTGEDYTKEAKSTVPPPRSRRSIIGYTQDDTIIYNEAQRQKNMTLKDTTPPTRFNSHNLQAQDLDNHVREEPKMASYLKSSDSYSSRENPNVEFTVVSNDRIRTKHRPRRLELDERSVRYGRMRPLPTAHFSGDTSKYVYGQHTNFKGNGRLSHPQKTFVDWAESGWFHTLEMDRHFSFSGGILTVKEPGLYFIYAQIYYLDEHDTNGFRVYRNETDELLQCTTMTHSMTSVMKGNTCFTAAAEYLHENDRISLGDLSDSRYSLFEPGKSFFGVIKLGDVKIPRK